MRTGDTAASARREQIRRPPDVLITTPESLYLLLTGSGRALLSTVSTVILDEIHSVAGTKRGSHLALSLERLEALVTESGGRPPQRIALSATVEPVAEVAAFVGGAHRVEALVVDARKSLDLAVLSPKESFGRSEDGSAWEPAIEAVAAEAATHRTTLVFCNNRRHAERVAAKLEEKLGRGVPTHHGSVARVLREEIERDLKAGSLRVLVATGSLELGLDVGEIDSVVQIGSPKGVGRALQRVGRSGHLVGQTARGRLVPLYLDDLLECAATVEGMREGDVEETRPPEFPLDVLAQQIVAEVVGRGAEGATADALLEMFRRARPYRALPRSLFLETLAMLSGKYPKERFAALAAKLVWDRATGRVAALPGARLAALLDGGTIGDRGTFRAVLRDGRTVVGDLDEEFVYETRAGDVFLLGSRAWRALEISHDRVVVEDAAGQPARMPFWKGEGLGRTAKLAARVGRLKRFVAESLDDPALPGALAARYGCDPNAASAIAAAVRREALESPGVASDLHVVFETFPNDLGDPCVLVRSLFGRGVNLPWSLALASVLSEETGVQAEAVATDDGILLRLPHAEREIPLERLARLTSGEARERLLAELPNSALFGARFRENAQRALLLPRARSGRRTPFWLQRLRAKDLLQTTRQLPDFPIVAETYRDCLKDQWESDRLFRLLDDLQSGAVARSVDARKFPSPAAQGLLFTFVMAYMYEWDAPKAERGLHALAMNRELLGEVLGETLPDALRPEAADAARAEASRLVAGRMARSADELLLFFQELGDLTREEIRERSAEEGKEEGGKDWLGELTARKSVMALFLEGEERWIAAEDLPILEGALGRALAEPTANSRGGPDPRPRHQHVSSKKSSVLLRSPVPLRIFSKSFFVSSRHAVPRPPPTSPRAMASTPPASKKPSRRCALDALVVRGLFGAAGGPPRWAGARLAESVRRKTLALLRGEIRPVPVEAWRAFVAKRQGLTLGARFAGEHAAERALALLRGLPLPALSVETSILPARLARAGAGRARRPGRARAPRVARSRSEGPARRAPHVVPPRRGRRALLPPRASRARRPLRRGARSLRKARRLGRVVPFGSRGARRKRLRGKTPKVSRRARPRRPRHGRWHPGIPGDSAEKALQEPYAGLGAPLPFKKIFFSSLLLSEANRPLSPRCPPVAGPSSTRPPSSARRCAPTSAPRPGRESSSRAGESSRERRSSSRIRRPSAGRTSPRRLPAWRCAGTSGAARSLRDTALSSTPRRRRSTRSAPPRVPTTEASKGPGSPWRAEAIRSSRASTLPPSRDSFLILAAGKPLLRLEADGAFDLDPATPDRTLRAGIAALQDLLRRARDPLGRPRRLRIAAPGSPLAPLLEQLGFVRDSGAYVWRAL